MSDLPKRVRLLDRDISETLPGYGPEYTRSDLIPSPQAFARAVLEAAAKVARQDALEAIGGAVRCHGEMSTSEVESCADDIAAAIRALMDPAALAEIVKGSQG